MSFLVSFRTIESTLKLKLDFKVLSCKTLTFKIFPYTIFFLCFSYHVKADFDQQPTIAIIIDDMGHSYDHGVELINLPFPLTLSFLPDRRFTNRLIEMANFHRKEIMLHVPMQNSMGYDLGYGGLKKNNGINI